MSDTETTTAATETATTTATKRTHAKPTFGLARVGDELPAPPTSERGGRTRGDLFEPMLTEIQSDPGTWYSLAEYTVATTAKRTAKYLTEQLELGTIAVTGQYEFDSRKTETGSALFARYLGE